MANAVCGFRRTLSTGSTRASPTGVTGSARRTRWFLRPTHLDTSTGGAQSPSPEARTAAHAVSHPAGGRPRTATLMSCHVPRIRADQTSATLHIPLQLVRSQSFSSPGRVIALSTRPSAAGRSALVVLARRVAEQGQGLRGAQSSVSEGLQYAVRGVRLVYCTSSNL